jgi:hypothetical protein
MKVALSVRNTNLKRITDNMEKYGQQFYMMYKGRKWKIANAMPVDNFFTRLTLESID